MARSKFYYHIKRMKLKEKYVLEKEEIKDIFHEHKGRYGYRRITAEMRNRNYVINHKTVQRLMGEMGLKCKIRKVRYRSYRGEIGKVAPNGSIYVPVDTLPQRVTPFAPVWSAGSNRVALRKAVQVAVKCTLPDSLVNKAFLAYVYNGGALG